ncbi:GNAT family N-acetyltransferase [Leisingera sp. M523]|uniref:GNAT family N-acetyltransferase n=1 Tax=Leisingera sp. M523 TaxID=2867013 RepID=UPI002201C7A4|nr:GNAT family N-acetyltransferase [Leisingera sp. M523]
MYSIRFACADDAAGIAKVHVQCWEECYPFLPQGLRRARNLSVRVEQWKHRLAQPAEGLTWVLEDEGRIVGFAHLAPNSDPEIPEAAADLHACYFLPEYRGSTAGPEMMAEMLRASLTLGWKTFCIWAWRENPIRITYRALGLLPVVRRSRELCGFSAPEVGYFHPDASAMIRKLENMAIQIERRGGETRSSRRFASRHHRTA